MKMSPRLRYLLAGAALILATNIVVLSGVAYNRSGKPESTLTLTQRELRLPYQVFARKSENSGIDLNLLWRVAVERNDRTPAVSVLDYPGVGGAPAWLDKTKLAGLGFDVAELEKQKRDPRDYNLWHEKEVLLVLEFDGDVYQHVLAAARQQVVKDEALLVKNKEQAQLVQRLKYAKNRLENEETKNSRLFVVDAGLNLAALRAKYPDRTKYAIVHGLVRPRLTSYGKEAGIGGFVSKLSVDTINVPFRFRPVFAAPAGSRHFRATVSFGQRLEPWLAGASAVQEN